MPLHAVQANTPSPLYNSTQSWENSIPIKMLEQLWELAVSEQLLTLSVYKGGKNTVNGEPEEGRRDSSQRRQKEAGREQV